jgi:hypothetical protein
VTPHKDGPFTGEITGLTFLLVVNDPAIARHVCGFDGINPFVDLEEMGKQERQGHLSSWKSKQTAKDVTVIREAVPDAHLVVRINPLHDATPAEVDDVIARGADSVMLPMFHDGDTLCRFLDILNDRAAALPLFETAASVAGIPEILARTGLRQLHIGLNDLHLDLRCDFMFEPLASGYLEEPCAALRAAGVRFGIGGVARAGEGLVSPEVLLGEHVRLGSVGAILSQTFHRNVQTLAELRDGMDFGAELAKLRAIYAAHRVAPASALEENRAETARRVAAVVKSIREKKGRDVPVN